MEKYNLTPADIQTGVNRLLADAYSTATISENPSLVYISAGPGAGKTAIESFLKRQFKQKGERAYIVNSDKIAQFHPYYEDALEELPEECYRITRQFVRPAAPKIYEELMKNKINLINENTLDKGESDIQLARQFKENGYRISANIIATDIFESRLSCYEREAASLLAGLTPRGCSKETQMRMYNSFVAEIQELDRLGLCDEINVYTRGENINMPPVLKYSKDSSSYNNFYEALVEERAKQRKKLLDNPTEYFLRIDRAKRTISEFSTNEKLKENSLLGLKELQSDFILELSKNEVER